MRYAYLLAACVLALLASLFACLPAPCFLGYLSTCLLLALLACLLVCPAADVLTLLHACLLACFLACLFAGACLRKLAASHLPTCAARSRQQTPAGAASRMRTCCCPQPPGQPRCPHRHLKLVNVLPAEAGCLPAKFFSAALYSWHFVRK